MSDIYKSWGISTQDDIKKITTSPYFETRKTGPQIDENGNLVFNNEINENNIKSKIKEFNANVDNSYFDVVSDPSVAKKLALSANPEQEEAKIKNSIYLSKILNEPFQKVYSNYDLYSKKVIGGKTTDPISDYEIIRRAKQTGEMNLELSTLGWKWLTGQATEKDINRIQEILRTMPQDSFDAKRGILVNLQRAFWQNWAIIRETIKHGITDGLVPGAAAGLGTVAIDTALGGPAGLALSPATFLTATAIGVGAASGNFIAKMEAGSEFVSLMNIKYTDKDGNEHDLPDNVKKTIAYTVGALNSLIEVSQFETLFTGGVVSKGLKSAANKIFGKVFKKAIASNVFKATVVKFAKELAVKGASEVAQELGQQLISDAGVLIARVANDEHISTDNARQIIKGYTGLAIDTFLVSTLLSGLPTALQTTSYKIHLKAKVHELVKNAIQDFNPETQTVDELINKIKSSDEFIELSKGKQEKITKHIESSANVIKAIEESKAPLRKKPLSEIVNDRIEKEIDKRIQRMSNAHEYFDKNTIRDKLRNEIVKENELNRMVSDEEIEKEYQSYKDKALELGVEPLSKEEYTNMRYGDVRDIKIYSMDDAEKNILLFKDVLQNLKDKMAETKTESPTLKNMILGVEELIYDAENDLKNTYTVDDLIAQSQDKINQLDERISALQEQLKNKDIDSNTRAELYNRLADLRSQKFDETLTMNNYSSLLNKAFKNYYDFDKTRKIIKDRLENLQKHIIEQKNLEMQNEPEQIVVDLLNDESFREAVGLPLDESTDNLIKNTSEKKLESYIHLAIKAGYFSGQEAYRQETLHKWIISKNKKSYSNLIHDTAKSLIDYIKKAETKNISSKRAKQIEALKKIIEIEAPSKKKLNELYKYIYEATEGEDPIKTKEIADNIINLSLDDRNPKTTLKSLYDLRDYVDFLRFIGKRELEESKKSRILLEEQLKDAVIENIDSKLKNAPKGSNLSGSDLTGFKKLANGVKVFAMMPAEWAKRVGGDLWVDVFVKRKLMTKLEELKNQERRSAIVRELIQDVLKGTEYEGKDIGKIFFDTVQIGDKEYQKQDLMYYYLGRNNEMTREALINSNGISEDLLNNVDKYLTDEEKLIAEEIADDFQEVYPRLAEAYEKLTGQRLGFQRNWVPQIRELDTVRENIDKEIADLMLMGVDIREKGVDKTFTYERKGGSAPIRTDLYGLWRDMLPKQEHYIASAELVSTMKRVMKDKGVVNAITQKYGKAWVNEINKYIDDYASPQSMHATDFLSRMFRWLKNGTAISALTLNGPVIARMPVSIVFYMMKSGVTHLLSSTAQFIRNPREIYEFVKQRDPATIRSGTEYEFMNMKDQHDLIKLKDKIIKGLVSPISIADKITKVIGWKAVYDAYVDELGEYGAIKEARYWTDLTQPTGDKTALPGLYRTHEILSLLNLFTQQPMKIFNLLHYEITGNIREGDYGSAFLGLLGASMSMAAMWMISNRRLPESEEDLTEMFMGGYLSTYPIVGKALYALTQSQYPSHPTYIEIAKPLADIAKKDTYSEEGAKKLAKDMLKSLAVSLKMPYVGPYRIYKSIENSDPSYFFFGGPLGE